MNIYFMYAYTPLVTPDTFTGMTADVQTTALVILGILLTIAAVGILARMFFK